MIDTLRTRRVGCTSLALGLDPATYLFVSVALTFSITIIIVKLLADKRELETLHGRIPLGFLIVHDIVVVLAMIIFGLGRCGGAVGRAPIAVTPADGEPQGFILEECGRGGDAFADAARHVVERILATSEAEPFERLNELERPRTGSPRRRRRTVDGERSTFRQSPERRLTSWLLTFRNHGSKHIEEADMREEVERFRQGLDSDTRATVDALRAIVAGSHSRLTEGIKWNAPSFALGGEDRITLGLERAGGVRVVVHRGSRPSAINGFKFDDPAALARWPAPDRGVIVFRDEADVRRRADTLRDLCSRWLEATDPDRV